MSYEQFKRLSFITPK